MKKPHPTPYFSPKYVLGYKKTLLKSAPFNEIHKWGSEKRPPTLNTFIKKLFFLLKVPDLGSPGREYYLIGIFCGFIGVALFIFYPTGLKLPETVLNSKMHAFYFFSILKWRMVNNFLPYGSDPVLSSQRFSKNFQKSME